MLTTKLTILAALLTPALICRGLVAQVEEKPVPATQEKEKPKPANQAAKAPPVYKLGSTVATDLALTDIHGRSHTFASLRGKVVFLHFWDMRCPAIKSSQTRLNAIFSDYTDKDVVVLGINANQREIGLDPALTAKAEPADAKKKQDQPAPYADIRKFTDRNKIPYPILVDHNNKVTDMFRARTTPHCYVIDQKGVLRYAGALDDDPRGRKGDQATRYVRDAIDALLAGKAYENSSTKPYG